MKSSEQTIVFTPKLLHSFTPYTKQVIFNHESHEWTRMGKSLSLLLLTCIAETLSRKIRRLTQKHALLSLACASGVIALTDNLLFFPRILTDDTKRKRRREAVSRLSSSLLHSFTPYTKQVIFNHESHEWTRMGSPLTAHSSPLIAHRSPLKKHVLQHVNVNSLRYSVLP